MEILPSASDTNEPKTWHIQKSWLQYAAVASGLGLALNLLWLHQAWLGATLGILWVYLSARALGHWAKADAIRPPVALGFGALIALLGFLGAILYHLWNIDTLPLLMLLAGITFVGWQFTTSLELHLRLPQNKLAQGLILAYLLLASCATFILWQARTSEALRSPWDVVPHVFWVFLFAATLTLLLYSWRVGYSAWLTTLHTALICGVAVLVYQVGYGFDPFIHLATEKYISWHGFITPKKLYYLGQYVPLIFFHRTTAISLEFLNIALVPMTAAVLLPAAIKAMLVRINRAELTLLALALPVTAFIMTTPQNLANLYFLIGVCVMLAGATYARLCWVITLGALVTHPIAGVPLLGLTLLAFPPTATGNMRTLTRWLGSIIALFGLPAAFGLLSFTTPYHVDISLTHIPWRTLLPFGATFIGNLSGPIGLVYTYRSMLVPSILILALAGTIAWKKNENTKLYPLYIMLGGLVLNAILLAGVLNFPFLIGYEQLDFAKRLVSLALLALGPLALVTLVKAIPRQGTYIYVAGVLFAAAICAATYLSYPTNDKFERSRGFSVTSHDFSAIEAITQDAANSKYVVLANQNLGAAALATQGFAPSYLGPDGIDQYLYSIPTGGSLYKYFYEIAERKGSVRENIAATFKDFPVDTVYLVLSDYWEAGPRVLEQAIPLANKMFTVDYGKLTVVKFVR